MGLKRRVVEGKPILCMSDGHMPGHLLEEVRLLQMHRGQRAQCRSHHPDARAEQVARDLSLAEIERVLETLIVLAHNQQRNFLAYLLVMALMHVREEDQGYTGASH